MLISQQQSIWKEDPVSKGDAILGTLQGLCSSYELLTCWWQKPLMPCLLWWCSAKWLWVHGSLVLWVIFTPPKGKLLVWCPPLPSDLEKGSQPRCHWATYGCKNGFCVLRSGFLTELCKCRRAQRIWLAAWCSACSDVPSTDITGKCNVQAKDPWLDFFFFPIEDSVNSQILIKLSYLL